MWYVYWLSKLKQAIAEAEKLDMSRAKSYTLGAWIKLWYEVYAEPRLREKTKDYYCRRTRSARIWPKQNGADCWRPSIWS